MKHNRVHFPKPLPHEEQSALCVRAQRGDDEARWLLIRSNVQFLYAQAKYFAAQTSLLEVDDLLGEGFLGMHRAIDGFDPDHGERFLTFAAHWVQHHMREAVLLTAIRLTAPVDTLTRAWSNRFARDREAMRARGVPEADIEAALAKAHKMRPARLLAAEGLRHAPKSMDEPIGESDDAGRSMHDVIASGAPSAEERVTDQHWLAHVRTCIALFGSKLPFTRRVVFAERILGGHTLDYVATVVGFSGERVRQIESELLAELRRSLRADFPDELVPDSDATPKRPLRNFSRFVR